jgi:hypothetical protein
MTRASEVFLLHGTRAFGVYRLIPSRDRDHGRISMCQHIIWSASGRPRILLREAGLSQRDEDRNVGWRSEKRLSNWDVGSLLKLPNLDRSSPLLLLDTGKIYIWSNFIRSKDLSLYGTWKISQLGCFWKSCDELGLSRKSPLWSFPPPLEGLGFLSL